MGVSWSQTVKMGAFVNTTIETKIVVVLYATHPSVIPLFCVNFVFGWKGKQSELISSVERISISHEMGRNVGSLSPQ